MLFYYFLAFFFFLNDTATTEIYTLSLHDALPISGAAAGPAGGEGEAAGGPAVADAHELRPGNDAGGRVLLRDRELLAAHRRPVAWRAPVHAPRLLPGRLALRDRRVPRDGAPAPRHVRGRHVTQADPGGIRVPAPVGHGQPPAPVRGVHRTGQAGGVHVGHPRPVRAPGVGSGGGADR